MNSKSNLFDLITIENLVEDYKEFTEKLFEIVDITNKRETFDHILGVKIKDDVICVEFMQESSPGYNSKEDVIIPLEYLNKSKQELRDIIAEKEKIENAKRLEKYEKDMEERERKLYARLHGKYKDTIQ